eukprot:scaffold2748_cov193-Alexandrium_tamarense.AAC.11
MVHKMINEKKVWKGGYSVSQAIDIWNKEFSKADRPVSETYQFSCTGRHDEAHIFSGRIVPLLNKMLSCAEVSATPEGIHGRPFEIVRVETTKATYANTKQEEAESNDKMQIETHFTYSCVDVNGEDAVGKGIARPLDRKRKQCIIRGKITKYLSDEEMFCGHYSDGTRLKLDEEQARGGRVAFEKECKRLVGAGIPQEDASNMSCRTVGASKAMHKVRQPVLEDGEDEDPSSREKIFEEVFNGEIPDTIVGLQFAQHDVNFKNNRVPLWDKVLMSMSEHLVKENVMSALQIAAFEKSENELFKEESSLEVV